MLIIKIENRVAWLLMLILGLLTLGGGYYLKQGMYRKPVACLGEMKIKDDAESGTIRKHYALNFYLNEKNHALVFINGVYIGNDNEPRAIQRTLSFDAFWSANRLIVHNVVMEKGRDDNAPDEAFTMMGENEALEFEMLTGDAYLISTARAKLACNIQ